VRRRHLGCRCRCEEQREHVQRHRDAESTTSSLTGASWQCDDSTCNRPASRVTSVLVGVRALSSVVCKGLRWITLTYGLWDTGPPRHPPLSGAAAAVPFYLATKSLRATLGHIKKLTSQGNGVIIVTLAPPDKRPRSQVINVRNEPPCGRDHVS